MSDSFWKISASGYGDFCFFGTEKEAEEMRLHKARWEGSAISTKRRILSNSRLAKAFIDWNKFEVSTGVPVASELRERIETYLGDRT